MKTGKTRLLRFSLEIPPLIAIPVPRNLEVTWGVFGGEITCRAVAVRLLVRRGNQIQVGLPRNNLHPDVTKRTPVQKNLRYSVPSAFRPQSAHRYSIFFLYRNILEPLLYPCRCFCPKITSFWLIGCTIPFLTACMPQSRLHRYVFQIPCHRISQAKNLNNLLHIIASNHQRPFSDFQSFAVCKFVIAAGQNRYLVKSLETSSYPPDHMPV
jgi:hypothetical protein